MARPNMLLWLRQLRDIMISQNYLEKKNCLGQSISHLGKCRLHNVKHLLISENDANFHSIPVEFYSLKCGLRAREREREKREENKSKVDFSEEERMRA